MGGVSEADFVESVIKPFLFSDLNRRSDSLVVGAKSKEAGNDGLVIMPDGTKYVSSVVNGGVSRMRPNQPAELIARNIPNAASMCYDAGGNQLVIPMNPNNGLAFVPLK